MKKIIMTLGVIGLLSGCATPIDPLKQAADNGDPKAEIDYARKLYAQGNFHDYETYMTSSMDHGNSDAMMDLYEFYLNDEDKERGETYSTLYLSWASMAGNPTAQGIYGKYFRYGQHGKEKNLVKARELFQQALIGTENKYYADTLLQLGDMYLNGLGGDKEVNLAIDCYSKVIRGMSIYNPKIKKTELSQIANADQMKKAKISLMKFTKAKVDTLIS